MSRRCRSPCLVPRGRRHREIRPAAAAKAVPGSGEGIRCPKVGVPDLGTLVIRGADCDVDADVGASVFSVGGQAGVLQGAPAHLEEQALLGIERPGFCRGNIEEGGVEEGRKRRVEEAAPARDAGPRTGRPRGGGRSVRGSQRSGGTCLTAERPCRRNCQNDSACSQSGGSRQPIPTTQTGSSGPRDAAAEMETPIGQDATGTARNRRVIVGFYNTAPRDHSGTRGPRFRRCSPAGRRTRAECRRSGRSSGDRVRTWRDGGAARRWRGAAAARRHRD